MVTRWDADLEARCMFNCSDDDYVLFEDYEDELFNVQYDLKALQRKYDLLVEKIGEIYREA